jgi:hypothetical protein
VNATTLGTLISGLAGLLFIILSVVSFRARRSDKRAANLASVRETNIAALSWAYQVRTLAAVNGWQLPPLPKEMTVEYLAGKAEGEGNPELAGLATFAASVLGQSPGGGE